jgi:hypothetical protein
LLPEDKPAEEVEAAIAEVLAAERDALAAIEAARREGEGILLGARTQARRIAERGEQRLARLREAAARRIRQQTEQVEAEIARLAAAAIDSPADEAAIAARAASQRRWIHGGAAESGYDIDYAQARLQARYGRARTRPPGIGWQAARIFRGAGSAANRLSAAGSRAAEAGGVHALEWPAPAGGLVAEVALDARGMAGGGRSAPLPACRR